MVTRLAKRLHEAYMCEFLQAAGAKGKPWCKGWEQHIKMAQRILGEEYVFITIQEFTELRDVFITV